MPRIYLGFILAYKIPDRRVSLLLAAGVLFSTPYNLFLETSRALILANFLSLVFLMIAFVGTVDKQRRGILTASVFVIMVLFGAYVFGFSGSRRAQGIVAFDRVQAAYQETEKTIRDRKSEFQQIEISESLVYNPDTPATPPSEPVTPAAASSTSGAVSSEPVPDSDKKALEEAAILKGMKIGTSVFRILIWKDAEKELLSEKPVFGFDFGKPFRSESLEIMRWGVDDWRRDGWIAMHNSYLYIIYRAGVVGIGCILAIWLVFGYLVRVFVRLKSVIGLLLCASLLVPLIAAYFSVTLELPYTAIPIWTLYGLTLAYAHRQMEAHKDGASVPQRI